MGCKILNYISELSNLDNIFGHRLVKHDNDISLSKLYGRLSGLYYVNYSYILTCRKDTNFIETKVTVINCGVLSIACSSVIFPLSFILQLHTPGLSIQKKEVVKRQPLLHID